jgi:hypothetical protein
MIGLSLHEIASVAATGSTTGSGNACHAGFYGAKSQVEIDVVSVFFPGEPPVQMFARVAPLSGGLELSFQLAGRRIQGVEIAIVGIEVSQTP